MKPLKHLVMKKIAIQKSTAVLLLLSTAALFSASSAFGQKPTKKEVNVVVVNDSIVLNTNDSTTFVEEFNMDELQNVVFKSMEDIDINLDSINNEVSKALADIHIEIDSLPVDIDIPEIESIDESDFTENQEDGAIHKRIEVQRVDDSNPKALEETLRKLELEGKITTKGEYTGVKTVSITKGDKKTERVLLMPKGKKTWIDAKTGQPVETKHRAMRIAHSPRHRQMFYSSNDSIHNLGDTTRGQKHIYISHGHGKDMKVRVISSDSCNIWTGKDGDFYSTDTMIVRKHKRGGRNHIYVTSKKGSDENVDITVMCNDTLKTIHRSGKSQTVCLYMNSNKPRGKRAHAKTYIVKVNCSDKITPEEKTMLEKSGFKKEKEGETLPAENLSVYPNPSTGQFKVALTGVGEGSLLVKIADSNGTILINEKTTPVNGSFEKEYSLESPADGVYFLQATVNGKSLTRKVLIKK